MNREMKQKDFFLYIILFILQNHKKKKYKIFTIKLFKIY